MEAFGIVTRALLLSDVLLLPVLQGAPPQYYSSRQMLVGSPCLETTQLPDETSAQVSARAASAISWCWNRQIWGGWGGPFRTLATIIGAERPSSPVLNIAVALCVSPCVCQQVAQLFYVGLPSSYSLPALQAPLPRLPSYESVRKKDRQRQIHMMIADRFGLNGPTETEVGHAGAPFQSGRWQRCDRVIVSSCHVSRQQHLVSPERTDKCRVMS